MMTEANRIFKFWNLYSCKLFESFFILSDLVF